jgi:hypothetical protein
MPRRDGFDPLAAILTDKLLVSASTNYASILTPTTSHNSKAGGTAPGKKSTRRQRKASGPFNSTASPVPTTQRFSATNVLRHGIFCDAIAAVWSGEKRD